MTHFKKIVLAAAVAASSSLLVAPQQASASCSSQPMLGGICWMASNYCPQEYAEANGQELQQATNRALYALLQTTYGGTAQTFRLPDLRGRSVVGLDYYSDSQIRRGDMRGGATTTMTLQDMPAHSHMIDPSKFKLSGTLKANISGATSNSPAGGYPGVASIGATQAYSDNSPTANMKESIVTGNLTGKSGVTAATGAYTPINITAPRIGLTPCIAIKGAFPPRG